MYSWQIAETLENNDYNIDSETFIKIIILYRVFLSKIWGLAKK